MILDFITYLFKPTSERAFFIVLDVMHTMSDEDLQQAAECIKSTQFGRSLKKLTADS